MLTVITAAASHRLTTPDAVRQHLSIGEEVADAYLGELIDRASAAVGRFCDRAFALETVREVLRQGGGDELQLTRWPVLAVQSVAAPDPLAADGYELDGAKGFLLRLGGWWRGRVEVVYQAGYVLPGQNCQSALNWDPRSARKRDPLVRCVEGAFRRGS